MNEKDIKEFISFLHNLSILRLSDDDFKKDKWVSLAYIKQVDKKFAKYLIKNVLLFMYKRKYYIRKDDFYKILEKYNKEVKHE